MSYRQQSEILIQEQPTFELSKLLSLAFKAKTLSKRDRLFSRFRRAKAQWVAQKLAES